MKIRFKDIFSDKQFNKLVIAVAVPIIVQNGITNLVSLLDNIMIGQVGTESMSGVAIVNQLMFVFNLCIFGAISGAGIFTAQFFGRGDSDGIRFTVRYKMLVSLLVSALFITAFLLFGRQLATLYITDDGSGADPTLTLDQAMLYLKIIVIQMPFFAIGQVYAGTLRETNETVLPMLASIAAFVCNFIGNGILIFGLLGAPAMGVEGAAIATCLARVVECGILVVYSHAKSKKHPEYKGLFSSVKIPVELFKQITFRGAPLILNETFWAVGIAMLAQAYSQRGLDVVAAYNIASTFNNLFSVVLLAMGSAVAIIIGNYLGSGKTDEAVLADVRLIVISVSTSIVVGGILAALCTLFPAFYNTSDEIKGIASTFILIYACCMPLIAYVNCTYFTLRSGGKTYITLLFDSFFECFICVPTALLLVNFTALPATAIYAVINVLPIVKVIFGTILLKKKIWINDLTVLED